MFDPNRWQALTLDVFVDQSGNVLKRYAPKDKPSAIAKDIEKLLA